MAESERARVQEILIQFGQPSSSPGLEWAWVDALFTQAGTYRASLGTNEQPHPHPVWGTGPTKCCTSASEARNLQPFKPAA